MFFSNNKLQVKKITENATLPTKANTHAAGYDLYSAYNYRILSRDKCLIKTDIQIKCPSGTYGRIAPRSSMSWNNHTSISAGVIDKDYRGNICIVMFNHSNNIVSIKKGDRVAQIICEKIKYPILIEKQNLPKTDRDCNGFGSTEKK